MSVLRYISGIILLWGVWTNVIADNTLQNPTQKKLIQIADDYERAYFERFPEYGAFLGKEGVAQDRFMDHSLQATHAWQKEEDKFLAALNKLNLNDLKNTPEQTTCQLLKQILENEKAIRICHDELTNMNSIFGWHNLLTMIAEKQPIGTLTARTQALSRWRAFDKIVADEIINLKQGIKEGYTVSRPVVERVAKQIHLIINTPVEDSPFFEFAKRDGDAHFKKQVVEVITNVINPSLQRYVTYLKTDYLPHARKEIGISALPHGEACYQAKIQRETTLTLSPQEIHEYGLHHMKVLQHEVAVIGKKQFGLEKMTEVFTQAKNTPQYLFRSEEEQLQYNHAALEKAKANMSNWFNLMPKSGAVIQPYPLYLAKTGAPGQYQPPSQDGTRPGVFLINTYQPEKRSRVDQEATLFHELIPGHHFQVALTFEDKTHHSLDKYLWNSGFGEGWALYVERLADEMGLYKDDISRLGMLSNEAMRTARCVVDPGIHVMGWTKEQAVDYLKQHTALDETIAEAEIDRYISLPGQATSYMLGKREIENARTEAKTVLGDAFDIRQYHDQVLKNGTVTLPMLRAQIKDWLTTHIS